MLLRVKQKIIGFKTEYCKITFTFYFKYQDSNNKFTIGRELKWNIGKRGKLVAEYILRLFHYFFLAFNKASIWSFSSKLNWLYLFFTTQIKINLACCTYNLNMTTIEIEDKLLADLPQGLN